MSPNTYSKRRTLSETSGNSPKRPKLGTETPASPGKDLTLRPAQIAYAGSTPVGPNPLRDCKAKLAEDIESLQWDQAQSTAANRQGVEMLNNIRQLQSGLERIESRLGRTESDLRQTVSKLGQTESDLRQTESDLRQTVSKLGQTEYDLRQIESKLGQTESKLGQTGSKLGQTESKLGQTKSRLGEVQSELQVVRQQARINDALHQTSKDVRRRAILSFHRDSEPTHRQDEELCREIRGLNKESVHGGNVLADAHAIKEYYTSTDMPHRDVAYNAFETLYGTTPDNILQADVSSTAASVRTLNSIATQLYKLPKRHLTEEASQRRQSLVELLNQRQYEKAELFCEENNEYFALPEKGQESKLLVHEQNHPTCQDESTLPSNRRPNRSHRRKRGRRRA